MRGRKPTLNKPTASRPYYSCTVLGTLHNLGTEQKKAREQFDYLPTSLSW
jgi:hypothetical protein